MNALLSHPILSCPQAKAHEAALLRNEESEWEAMQRAGRAIARTLLEDAREIGGLPDDARLLVLAGKGHNGGDALLAAALLLDEFPLAAADVVMPFGVESLRPLARRALDVVRRTAAARARETDAATVKRELASYDACLDGIFGFQFRPPLDEATAELIAWVNTHPRIRIRVAIDLPSGVGEEARAKTAFRADFTYATGIVKRPVVAAQNADVVGRVRYLDLGFFSMQQPDSADRVLRPQLVRPLGELRATQADKRTFGHLVVVGGSMSYPGAVLMTVQAALRSGVGLLTAVVPEPLVAEYAAKLPEAMWSGYAPGPHGGLTPAAVDLVREKSARATAMVVGPGLGAAPETIAAIEAICGDAAIAGPLLLDADALRPEIIRACAGRRIVATPHAGEWQRIRDEWTDGVLVLKGAPTRLRAMGLNYFSFFGGPVLARGGSGDLLAGLAGGRMAQAPDDLLLAAAQGVVWHGLAADLLARDKGQVAVQTTQLLDYLQPALHCTDHENT